MIKIKEEWSCKKLDEIGTIGRGKSKHRPRNDPRLYGGKYPFIQTSDVKNAELYLSRYSQTYNEEGLKQSKLWNPNTLCITIAAHIAETAILKINACFPDSIVGFVADENKADVRFIKYYIDIIKLQMQNISKGTTQDNLSLDKLLTFDFLLPPLEIQQKIASILSSYDDLIENNTRRIEILEEMAKLVYEEWFVKFRFPGHENVKMVPSDLGEIPEGWKVAKLCDIVDIKKGKKAKNIASNQTPETTPYILIDGLKTGAYLHTNDENGVSIEKYETVMVMDGASSGKVFIGCEGFVGSTLAVIKNKSGLDIDPYLIFNFLDSNFGKIVPNNVGSAIPHANKDFILSMDIVLPPKEMLGYSRKILSEIYSLKNTLIQKNQNLRKTRDLLLPKLISGEIDVSDLDIHIRNEFQES